MIAGHWRVKYYSEPFNPDLPDCPVRHYFHYMTEEDELRFRAYLKPILQLNWLGESRETRLKSLQTAWRISKSAYQWTWRRLGGRPLLKDPMALLSADWLASRYHMDTIVLIRHPAAFAGSLKRLDWHFPFENFLRQPRLMEDHLRPFHDAVEQCARRPPNIVDQAVLLWRILHTVILRYRSEHPKWQFVRHEDISARPLEEFGKLFKALGLGWSAHIARTIVQHTGSENPTEAAEGAVHQLKRNSRDNIWNWTQRLDRDEISRIRKGTEDVASRFYSDSDWTPPADFETKTRNSRPRKLLDALRAAS
jgi:hypothetical protein